MWHLLSLVLFLSLSASALAGDGDDFEDDAACPDELARRASETDRTLMEFTFRFFKEESRAEGMAELTSGSSGTSIETLIEQMQAAKVFVTDNEAIATGITQIYYETSHFTLYTPPDEKVFVTQWLPGLPYQGGNPVLHRLRNSVHGSGEKEFPSLREAPTFFLSQPKARFFGLYFLRPLSDDEVADAISLIETVRTQLPDALVLVRDINKGALTQHLLQKGAASFFK